MTGFSASTYGASLQTLPGALRKPYTAPGGLVWDGVNYPINVVNRQLANGRWTGDMGLSAKSLFPGYTGWPTYYVKVDGNNSNNGSTEALAFKSLYKPIAAAIAAAQTQIYVKVKGGGLLEFDRNNTFCLNGVVTTIQGVTVVYEAYGGRVRATTAQPALTWTASGDGYTAPLSSTVARVFDKLARDRFGHYVEMTKQSTQSSALTGMDTYSQISNVLAIRRKDGALPTTANTLVLVSIKNLYVDGTSQVSVGLFGATAADGFDLEGGDAGCFRINFTGGAGGPRVVIAAENCTFRYSGAATGSIGDFAAEGVNGLTYLNNCSLGCSGNDATNQHNLLGATSYVIWNNVTAYDTGRSGTYVSCNPLTGHDTMTMILNCCRGSFARGVTAHLINNVKAWVIAPDFRDSLGDTMNVDAANANAPGGNQPTEFKIEDQAEAWIEDGNLSPSGGNGYGYVVAGSAKLHLRNTPVMGALVVQGSGTVDTY